MNTYSHVRMLMRARARTHTHTAIFVRDTSHQPYSYMDKFAANILFESLSLANGQDSIGTE